jgi:3-deoxy-D-manno-octulosonic-acid transferase
MILFFYNLALISVMTAGVPWWLWCMATKHKYREGIGERLGRVPGRLVAGSAAGRRPLIWVHAVSVGEVLAVTRLVKTLDVELRDYMVVVSTTTRTGQALARERFGANRVFYCPLDLPWAVRAFLRALKPRILVLAETEFWPNLLNGCFRRTIPVVVVNARISNRSWPRYRRLGWFWRPLLGQLSRVLAQSERDAERLGAIGCAPQCVSVAGNLKFDVRVAQESDVTQILRSIGGGLRFVVAGSTLEGEEAALLDAWPQLLFGEPQLAMVLAPRHPERFAAVASLLERSGNAWVRRSSFPSVGSPASGHDFSRAEAASKTIGALAPARPLRPGTIILLDTIGELASVYSLACVAFVGGSLVPAGGHNPLEPAQFGVPIVMGPHYANFTAITDALRANNALRIAAKEELTRTLAQLLGDRDAAAAMGARAREVFEREAGATERCVAAIRELLAANERVEQRA